MTTSRETRIACVTAGLDWSHRQRTSGARYDAARARAYVTEHVDASINRITQAAQAGAQIVLCPEYFAGTELFMVDDESRRQLIADTGPNTLRLLKDRAAALGIHIACSMDMDHGDMLLQTGLLVHPGGGIDQQVKNTGLPPGHPRAKGYELFAVDSIRSALLVCSDATSFPEDPIELAKKGMELLLVPGQGFAGADWMHFLKVRAIDLGCVVAYADGSRAAILDGYGHVHAQTDVADTWIRAVVDVEARAATNRLYSYVGRRYP